MESQIARLFIRASNPDIGAGLVAELLEAAEAIERNGDRYRRYGLKKTIKLRIGKENVHLMLGLLRV